jgi:hypothetical protein
MPQAIRSDSFHALETQEPDTQVVEITEEKQLGNLSYTEGWKLLKEYIESLKEDLDSTWKAELIKGSSFEEIGKRTIITQLTKEYLNKIIEKVGDARQAIEPTT